MVASQLLSQCTVILHQCLTCLPAWSAMAGITAATFTDFKDSGALHYYHCSTCYDAQGAQQGMHDMLSA